MPIKTKTDFVKFHINYNIKSLVDSTLTIGKKPDIGFIFFIRERRKSAV